MYIHMCVHTRIIYVCTYKVHCCVSVYICTYTCVYTHALYVYVRTKSLLCDCIYMYTHLCVHKCIIYICMYKDHCCVSVYICTNTCVYTHALGIRYCSRSLGNAKAYICIYV